MLTSKPKSSATYRAYIPTHLYNHILPKETNREALLEDAILNHYYQLIRSLIDSKILNETTYHFTCRDTAAARVHKYLKLDDYEYADPEYGTRGDGSLCVRTNDIIDYTKSITAHIALQMVGRFGDIKAFEILEPAVKLVIEPIEIEMFHCQITCAYTYALQRDEIDLFNRIRRRYPGTAYNDHWGTIIAVRATSLPGIARVLGCIGKTYQDILKNPDTLHSWAASLTLDCRWDLFQSLIPECEWVKCRYYALLGGSTELLEELYKRNQYVFDPAIIDEVKQTLLDGMVRQDAIIRTFTWVESKCPGFVMDDMISTTINGSPSSLTVALIEWYYRNGYKFNGQHVSRLIEHIGHIVRTCGYPSVEIIEWEACLVKLRSFGAMPSMRMRVSIFDGSPGLNNLLKSFPDYFEIREV
jgi:hypothetical protein